MKEGRGEEEGEDRMVGAVRRVGERVQKDWLIGEEGGRRWGERERERF